MRDNENRVMYNDRESVILPKFSDPTSHGQISVFNVIPGSVMLTHTVLEGFIIECNHTLITSNVSKENLLQ